MSAGLTFSAGLTLSVGLTTSAGLTMSVGLTMSADATICLNSAGLTLAGLLSVLAIFRFNTRRFTV